MNFWKEPCYGPKRQELNWINGCITWHDNICGCNEPAEHLLFKLAEKSGYLLVKKQKCLTDGGETKDTGKDDDIGLEDGELERLFAEDTEEDDGW